MSQRRLQVIIDRIRHVIEGEVGPGKVTQRMKEIFGEMDLDGNGLISHSEFKRAMSRFRVRKISHTLLISKIRKFKNSKVTFRHTILIIDTFIASCTG